MDVGTKAVLQTLFGVRQEGLESLDEVRRGRG